MEAVRGILKPEVRVNPSVPDVVTGDPEIDNPVGTVIATDVTVPEPPPLPHVVVQNTPVLDTFRHGDPILANLGIFSPQVLPAA